jgi:hypothetical protein
MRHHDSDVTGTSDMDDGQLQLGRTPAACACHSAASASHDIDPHGQFHLSALPCQIELADWEATRPRAGAGRHYATVAT